MISLSLLSTGHRLNFQLECVRPSTQSYPRFSLPMDRSPGFGSAACDFVALFRLAFASASPRGLTSPQTTTRWLIMQKVRGRTLPKAIVLPLLVDTRFQVLFTPLAGVLFTFPSRYLFAIGHQGVLSLGRWSSQIQTGFLVSRPTQEHPRATRTFGYGALTLFGAPSQALLLALMVPCRGPTTPRSCLRGLG